MQRKTFNPDKITKATQNDISDIHSIEEESFSNPWKISFFYTELANEFSNTFIYREKNKEPAAGFIIFRKVTDTIEILKIAVKKDFREKGIGSGLMNFLLSGQFTEGVNTFFLEVRASNEEVIRFYRTFKFNISGTRKNYYRNPAEDALILKFRKN